ncbi:methylmalonyl-CoA mutase [Chryseobacterium indologenes]|uniref:methylmalonyl-CoA mutase family protein n=1 Tax=Chryseobacterium indologenes TaxID=253 RepID=UPI0003E079FB|nr:methylmalonyl-CoA mutase family protein [Chryseobacterium indologenes]ASE61372.1 methylmalonyl-CoA mutase [Chryseobacterium indologenes]QPQ51546.1 methylmalonyl-CoA mutase [Chryseobacterium indologenes]SFI83335.1 methylmalonyl-CoA mutase [Chryseobacterium indologenes]SUX50013.1 Methylmalonyl-CoA mutase [Chryseobacterium indologenes]GAE65102.1 putative methylmalonyl-CoA mutase small subunit [Chryseobacterium indologenes NBRC 14944]
MSDNTLPNWESLVKKQLKTEDIYPILEKENLEGIEVKPFYTEVKKPLVNLPRVEESTHLVASYHESLEEEVFAFILDQNVENLEEKTIFVNNKDLAGHISPKEEDQYFSLIDVFNEHEGSIDDQLAKELLAKEFKRSICVDVSLHQNAGAAIYQQLGIALAKTKELVEKYGTDIINQLVFRIAVGGNYFFEMAKLRAFKIVFNQLSKEYGLDEVPYIFAETSLRNKAVSDNENNLIRSTLELASAMIGGADAVFSNNYLVDRSTGNSEEISFKQQIVLAYESIINVFEDASNGSYYVEDITRQIAEKSWALFVEIEETGGYLELLRQGIIQKKIYDHAVKEQQWIEEGKIKLIGVNLYPKLDVKKSIADLYNEKEIKAVRWAEMFE